MTCDVTVISPGKGGKIVAGTLAQAGKKVAMIEHSNQIYGGTCMNIACVPTMALIHSAEIRTGKDFDPEYFARSVERRDTLRGKMRDKNYAIPAA